MSDTIKKIISDTAFYFVDQKLPGRSSVSDVKTHKHISAYFESLDWVSGVSEQQFNEKDQTVYLVGQPADEDTEIDSKHCSLDKDLILSEKMLLQRLKKAVK